MSIDKLQPADKAAVGVYMPYYQGAKRNVLPYAISLYQQGSLEGQRHIEGGESIPFVASWFVSKLPSELTRCRLQFDGNADLSYEVTMANSEFINYLIEVIMTFKRSRLTDFSQAFYRKLLRIDE
ncbi:MAG TPA: type IV pilus biogenesis protein EbsA [Coleofasciculaceae cyanobacterium]